MNAALTFRLMLEVEDQNRRLSEIIEETRAIDEAIERQERINEELRKNREESTKDQTAVGDFKEAQGNSGKGAT